MPKWKKKQPTTDEQSKRESDESVEDKVFNRNQNIFHVENSHYLRALFPHQLFPKFNVNSQYTLKDFAELLEFPSCTFSVPHPIYVDPKHCSNVDICHRRTLNKYFFRRRLLGAQKGYKLMMRKRETRKLAKKDIYPASLFSFAERLECNPDKYFNEHYDYFYTGGNMCILQDSQSVAHVIGENLNEIRISEFSDKNEPLSHFNTIFSGNLSSNNEIFELKSIRSIVENSPDTFVMRQRNRISFHSYKGEGRLRTIKSINSKETPFISFAQNFVDPYMIAVTDLAQQVRIYNLEVNTSTTPLIQKTNMGEEFCWNSIKCWNKNVFIYSAPKRLTLLDMRTSPKTWLSNFCSVKRNEMECSKFSCLSLSKFDNLLYVGETHNLYCLDLRCFSKYIDGKNAKGTLCRWTHMMDYKPIIIETYKYENNELIAMSSPVSDDIRICENVREQTLRNFNETPSKRVKYENDNDLQFIYKSLCLPYQPPTMKEAYFTARKHGKALQPDVDLYNRIKCCTTGLSFWGEKGKNCLLLSSNSNGDVFGRTVCERMNQNHTDRTDANTTEIICKYENEIRKVTKPNKLSYTTIHPFGIMKKVFLCEALSGVKPEPPENLDLPDVKNNYYGRWQKPIPELFEYKDALAQDLLSIWDIDYKTDNSNTIPNDNLPVQPPTSTKTLVESWLNTNDVTMPDNISTIVHNTPLNNSNLIDNEDLGIFNSSIEHAMQSTQIVATPDPGDISSMMPSSSQVAKRKSKYVKGF